MQIACVNLQYRCDLMQEIDIPFEIGPHIVLRIMIFNSYYTHSIFVFYVLVNVMILIDVLGFRSLFQTAID